MEMSEISGMILAGGFSSRMGSNKAELVLNGQTLMEHQIEKLRALGVREILLSGYGQQLPGTILIPDEYPHRGPLSGVHACLKRVSAGACLVISVDVPLVPVETLRSLIQIHRSGITALVHGEKTEPLMAVYDCALWKEAEELLQGERTAIMRLLDRTTVQRVEYSGDLLLLSNCNTPEEFERIRCYAAAGKPDSQSP